ncbi:hypothetical protein DQP56_19575 [Mycolicibacter senuensis]|nr:hypothetical protein DQP56_19575 [Mycolicibacter senuensis]
MHSQATLPAPITITTTTGSRTGRPVGAIFGRNAGTATSWAKVMVISSTRSEPTVRHTGTITVSAGQ